MQRIVINNHCQHTALRILCYRTWQRHQTALLTCCAGNSPVTGEFPAQRPVTWNLDVFFDLHLNKRLSKQLSRWWFQMPSCPLWHHCDECSCKSEVLLQEIKDSENFKQKYTELAFMAMALPSGKIISGVLPWMRTLQFWGISFQPHAISWLNSNLPRSKSQVNEWMRGFHD